MMTTDVLHSEKSNSTINEIIRGEISAREAYEQVMEKVSDFPHKNKLKDFCSEHNEAVSFWKTQSRLEGKVPVKDSSIWGSVVEAFVGTSKVLGEEASLKALKTGEEHGLSNYEKMLESDELSGLQKVAIRNKFIPRQKNHIRNLESLMEKKA